MTCAPTDHDRPGAATGDAADVPTHDAEALTGRARRATILFRNQAYSLQITRRGRLILTKRDAS